MTPSPCRIDLEAGSIVFSYAPEAARQLQARIQTLIQSMKVAGQAQPGDRPAPQPNLDYQYAGEVFLEVFCNPNIWPSPFAAKVLLTVRDDRIRMSIETPLDRLIANINDYLDNSP